MAYQTASFPTTMSDLQWHSSIARLFIYDFSYTCAAVYNP